MMKDDLNPTCNANTLADTILSEMHWINIAYNKNDLITDLCDINFSLKCFNNQDLGFLYTMQDNEKIIKVILGYITSKLSFCGWNDFADYVEVHLDCSSITRIIYTMRNFYLDQPTINPAKAPVPLIGINLLFIIYKICRINSRNYLRLKEFEPADFSVFYSSDPYQPIDEVEKIFTDFANHYHNICKMLDYYLQNNSYNSSLHFNLELWPNVWPYDTDIIYQYYKEYPDIIYGINKISIDDNLISNNKLDCVGNYVFCTICSCLYSAQIYPIPTVIGEIINPDIFATWSSIDVDIDNKQFDTLTFVEIVDIVRDTVMVYKSITDKNIEKADEFLRAFNLTFILTIDVLDKYGDLNRLTSTNIKDILYSILFPIHKNIPIKKAKTQDTNSSSINTSKDKIKVSDLLLMMYMMNKKK